MSVEIKACTVSCSEDFPLYGCSEPTVCSVLQDHQAKVLAALRSVRIDSGVRVFTIADYGCSDGWAQKSLLYACVEQFRTLHGKELPIQVIYEDLPSNNYNAIFQLLQDANTEESNYVKSFPNVFVAACGKSFYEQCFPSRTIDFGFSSIAIQWLSKTPRDHEESIIYLSENTDVVNEFKEQAAADWELFLLQRAAELKPGGKLVLVQLVRTEKKNATFVSPLCLLNNLWEAMKNEGIITQEEFYKTTFAVYLRNLQDFRQPFEDPSSLVSKAGLSLVSMETKITPYYIYKRWKNKEEGFDSKKHGQMYAQAIRGWSYGTFASSLSDQRSSKERKEIVDQLFNRLELQAAASPDTHGLDYPTVLLEIEKK